VRFARPRTCHRHVPTPEEGFSAPVAQERMEWARAYTRDGLFAGYIPVF